MRRILSNELAAEAGHRVRLSGWVHRIRELKSVGFLVLRDRAGLAQVVTVPEKLVGLTEETVVSVSGTATANPAAPHGVEVTDPDIEVLGDAAEPPPFDLYRPLLRAALPTVLDNAAVALRHATHRRVHQRAAQAVAAFRSTLDGLGFVEIHTPKIVASATESGANVFAIDYFGQTAYLAQSPQFYKQMMVGVFERVYEVGPVFRAEPHDTVRHLAQYTSLDAELGFINDHSDVMAVVRDVVAAMAPELTVPAKIPELHFTEALSVAGAPADEPDLAPTHERTIGEWAAKEHDSDFVFVTGYPMAKRPFYTYPDPHRRQYSRSFDLLFRGMELVTGGQRLHRYADYVAALGGDTAPYQSYLDTFRHGMPPHGGFAIGLERFVARLLGLANVREAALFPRDLHRLTP